MNEENLPPTVNVPDDSTSELVSIDQSVKQEHWFNKRWRPAIAWSYLITCLFDFIVFPVLWSLLQAWHQGAVTQQWNPITLQGAGLYHLSMGAIIGVTAYGRTKEKITNTY